MNPAVIGNATLYLGDCLEVLRTLADNSVDSVVTDPPYGLSFMGKRWDYDVPSVEVWAECLRVLKPGGYLLAFAGTRTQHRMAVRIEDAGFEIRDLIAWVYGSGFPKSLDVSKAIDKAAGAEREVIGVSTRIHSRGASTGFPKIPGQKTQASAQTAERGNKITAPKTDEAAQWEGWGTALKPALEPITVARKPLVGTVAANVLRHGTGGLNIDGCRVAHDEDCRMMAPSQANIDNPSEKHRQAGRRTAVLELKPEGRWPANLIHDGSEEVLAGFPQSDVSGSAKNGTRSDATPDGIFGKLAQGRLHNDSGSAARFFYCAKASKRDREEGLDSMPAVHRANGNKWTDQDYRVSLGDRPPARESGPRRNAHPTVKPTDLMRYLCRLVTPPGGLVLDPFAGSGSTGRGAILEGFRFLGIEREAEYVEIACRRIEGAQRQSRLIA